MNDSTLASVEAARHGDEKAARRLIDQFHPRIFAFLRRLAGTESDAVELTQRTFCRAWSALDQFQGRASVSSWLHGIAYRTYVDWLRKNKRYEARSDEWWRELPDRGARPDTLAASSDAADAVYAAVDELESGLRETVHLHYYQGLTLEETADALGLATSTVKYRLRDAMQRIQRRLGESVAPRAAAPKKSVVP